MLNALVAVELIISYVHSTSNMYRDLTIVFDTSVTKFKNCDLVLDKVE